MNRSAIAPATKLKRGTESYLNGKPVYIERDRQDGTILITDDPNLSLDANYWNVLKSDLQQQPKFKTTLTLVKEIPKVSEKRAKENKIYLALRKVFLETHKTCEANLPGCKKAADQVHHAGGRVGKRLIDVSLFMAFCGNCHTWVNEHPTEAIEMGLAIKRL